MPRRSLTAKQREAESLIERLANHDHSIRPNDPCADHDYDEIVRIVAAWLHDLSCGRA